MRSYTERTSNVAQEYHTLADALATTDAVGNSAFRAHTVESA
jgi:hypothetical protein